MQTNMQLHEVRRQIANMTTLTRPICVNGARVTFHISRKHGTRRYQVEMPDGTRRQVCYTMKVSDFDIFADPIGKHKAVVDRVMELVTQA